MRFSTLIILEFFVIAVTGYGGSGYGNGYGGSGHGNGFGGEGSHSNEHSGEGGGWRGYGWTGYGSGWNAYNPCYYSWNRYPNNCNYYGKRNIPGPLERAECIFDSKINIINCNKGTIQCEASLHADGIAQKFDYFGINLNDGGILLLPKNFTGNTYSNYNVSLIDGSQKNLKIFKTDQEVSTGRGFKIQDSACYEKITDLIKTIATPVMSDLIGDSMSKIAISGFLLNL